jgi:glycosyltransferase involved in cell wall biosynthesis
MKIAMIGQKGIPAAHGGVERHVEELGAGLVALGHDVTVFTRPNYSDRSMKSYRGMTLRCLPTLGTKRFDAIVHSVLATLVCWTGGYDILHYHAMGPCLASPLARIRGRRIVATIHGQDWRRGKWGRGASLVLRLGEWMALHVSDATICVSECLSQEYRRATGCDVRYVPNGVTIDSGQDMSVLSEFGLTPGEYLLSVGRLVPEKGVHYLINAHKRGGINLPLVVVGGSSATDEYARALELMSDDGVVFAGYQYEARLAALFRHAALFVLPSDLEGLPIVLLEAMAYGTPVLASDIPPNVEILGGNGAYFTAGDEDSLTEALAVCLARLCEMKAESKALQAEVLAHYDWACVAVETSRIYGGVFGHRSPVASRRDK